MVYIPIIRIPGFPIKGGMTIPNTRSLDPSTFDVVNCAALVHRRFGSSVDHLDVDGYLLHAKKNMHKKRKTKTPSIPVSTWKDSDGSPPLVHRKRPGHPGIGPQPLDQVLPCSSKKPMVELCLSTSHIFEKSTWRAIDNNYVN